MNPNQITLSDLTALEGLPLHIEMLGDQIRLVGAD